MVIKDSSPQASFNFPATQHHCKMAYFTQQIIFIFCIILFHFSPPTYGAAISTPNVSLPALSGPHKVGTTEVLLTDGSTIDPFAPGPETKRTIIVQAFYPATYTAADYPFEPYMGPATAAFYENYFHLPNGSLAMLRTNSHTRAPMISGVSKPEIILFSPSLGASRKVYTTLVEDLASHGYIVISIDHPYDADIVELSDGTVILSAVPEDPTDEDIARFTDLRMNDTIFTLELLSHIVSAIPGAPGGRRVALGKIGIFGHSFGGAIAASIMLTKKCVVAGLNMDGMLRGPVVDAGLDAPFLLMGAAGHTRSAYATWQAFWDNQRGWKKELHLADAEHLVFSDLAVVVELLGLRDSPLAETIKSLVGTIDGLRANKVLRAYTAAFFDFALRGKQAALLHGPNPNYKEMEFVD